MDNKLLKQVCDMFKVSEEKVSEVYNDAKKFIDVQFEKASDEIKLSKIMNMVMTNLRPSTGGNTSEYKGIIIGISGIFDSNDFNRKNQLKLYQLAKQKADETGETTDLDSLIGTAVKIDANGNPIPLYPYYKNDGTKSAMAEKEIPSVKDSLTRNIYGFVYKEGNNPQEDLKICTLALKGKALNNIPPLGKIVSFKAGGNEYNGQYQLNSSVTDFVKTTDEYLQSGIDNVGVEGMIDKIFEDKVITFDNIEQWKKEFNGENNIPKELRQYVVIKDANCMTQNFEINAKGKISMQFMNDNFSIENTVTLIAGAEPEVGEKIEFAVNSSCYVIGQLSIFGKEGEEPMTWLNLMGAIGKKGLIVERQFDAQPLGEETKEEVVEEVKETSSEPIKKAW